VRKLGLGLVVINAAGLVLIGLTFWFRGPPGALSYVVPTVVGLAVVDTGILALARWLRNRRDVGS
jgi:uncharacterized membrane protein HdeD (DUF308 family)